jgi:hypothetical protein
MIPFTTGRYFWVAPAASYTVEGNTYEASDGNDGLSPERAFRTVDYAVGKCTANVGDVIVLLPGSHSVSATITVDVAGITIVGIPGSIPSAGLRHGTGGKRLRTSITSTGTAGIIFTVSATDVEIAYLNLAPPAAGGRGISLSALSGAANRAYIHDNTFSLIATASVTTFGITVPVTTGSAGIEDLLISRCYFVSGAAGASGANGPAVNILATAHGVTIEQSTFELKGTAAWADAILSSQGASTGLLIRDNDFQTPTKTTTVMTDAIDVTGMTIDGSTHVLRCYFPENTDAFEATATLDVMCSENYLSTSTSGAITGSV